MAARPSTYFGAAVNRHRVIITKSKLPSSARRNFGICPWRGVASACLMSLRRHYDKRGETHQCRNMPIIHADKCKWRRASVRPSIGEEMCTLCAWPDNGPCGAAKAGMIACVCSCRRRAPAIAAAHGGRYVGHPSMRVALKRGQRCLSRQKSALAARAAIQPGVVSAEIKASKPIAAPKA